MYPHVAPCRGTRQIRVRPVDDQEKSLHGGFRYNAVLAYEVVFGRKRCRIDEIDASWNNECSHRVIFISLRTYNNMNDHACDRARNP
jgi:hypothetical protein